MNTFGSKTVRVCRKEESYSINESFEAKEPIPNHSLVTLNADGTVSNTKAGEFPLGIVSAGNNQAGGLVTVQTPFNAIINAKASGAVAIGDKLDTVGLNVDKLHTNFKKTSSGTVLAQALTAGADGEDIVVGIFRIFTQL